MNRAIAAALIFVFGCAPAFGEDKRTVLGEWVGTYVCAQGLTGITLTIAEATPTTAKALFHFYADPANPRVPTGCYTMSGAYDPETGNLSLKGEEWINRPRGYVLVHFNGQVDAEGQMFSGRVKGPSCKEFELVRKPSPVEDAGQCVLPDVPATDSQETAGAIGEALAEAGSIDLDIRFEFDSARLLPESLSQVDELGRILLSPAFAGRRIGLYGHTDGAGSDAYNQRLSASRAEAVRDELASRFKIPAERIDAQGFGKSRLKLPDDPENAANRRVEVTLLD